MSGRTLGILWAVVALWGSFHVQLAEPAPTPVEWHGPPGPLPTEHNFRWYGIPTP